MVLKWRSMASLACSTSSVEALEVGFSECGFPKQPEPIRAVWAASCDLAASPAPV